MLVLESLPDIPVVLDSYASTCILFLQAEVEVERLDHLKSSKMKELVQKKRLDLEEICRCAHMEPDASTAEEKTDALIDSGTHFHS